jgi:hypothetical protein
MRYVRHVISGVALCGLMVLAGCNTFGFIRPVPQTRGDAAAADLPSKEALVGYLEANANYVQALRCDDLMLTASAGMGIVQKMDLHGRMMCQRPRNFRMSAEFMGKTEVEVGSNNEEFWYWLRRGEPPYQIHCSYKDLSDGKVRTLPFPFQPEWVIEALGLGNYGPADQYILDSHDPATFRLVAQSRSPQGKMVRKVIVFRSKKAQGTDAQVTDYLLLDDASGKEICAAHISQVMFVDVGAPFKVTIPYKVDMRWPEMKMRMSMRFDGLKVNPNPPIDPAVAFQRRPLNGVPSFDLATMRTDAPVQRVQGFDR